MVQPRIRKDNDLILILGPQNRSGICGLAHLRAVQVIAPMTQDRLHTMARCVRHLPASEALLLRSKADTLMHRLQRIREKAGADVSVGSQFKQGSSRCTEGRKKSADKPEHEGKLDTGSHLGRADIEIEDHLGEAASQR